MEVLETEVEETETADVAVHRLTLEYDTDFCENPCSGGDGEWRLTPFNTRLLGYEDPYDHISRVEGGYKDSYIVWKWQLARKLKIGLAFVVSCYEHSGVQWGLEGEVWQCPWDTTGVAGLLVWEHPAADMGAKTYKERQQDARNALKEYNDYANGQCFYYALEGPDGEHIDACGGFLGAGHFRESVLEMLADNNVTAYETDGDAAWVL